MEEAVTVIGCVKEIKKHEYRVGLTPFNVKKYVEAGHTVLIQSSAGEGSYYSNSMYQESGAEILMNAPEVYKRSDMIIKVKEPQKSEYNLLKKNQILFTFLHLAADRELTLTLLEKKISAVAYETIETKDGLLPCLKPMSQIAGRLSIQEGAKYLERPLGGRGVLLGGVPGIPRGVVTILGCGVVGFNAALMAVGLGARVNILDINSERLINIDNYFNGRVNTLYSSRENILKCLRASDLLIGAVLIPGLKAPHLVRRTDLEIMKKGSVIVDVAVDQGGCIESSHPTTHDNPVYIENDIVHYCVANMPGAVSKTSTDALTVKTLSYGLLIAEHGIKKACRINDELRKGLNTFGGKIFCEAVKDSLNI